MVNVKWVEEVWDDMQKAATYVQYSVGVYKNSSSSWYRRVLFGLGWGVRDGEEGREVGFGGEGGGGDAYPSILIPA